MWGIVRQRGLFPLHRRSGALTAQGRRLHRVVQDRSGSRPRPHGIGYQVTKAGRAAPKHGYVDRQHSTAPRRHGGRCT
ncbi:hypothetical protein ACU4GD_15150 [Cupriavidus basilensis]